MASPMQLIPAIDLRHGQVVRLVQGDDARKTAYGVDPREMLARFAEAGIELVHVVDLDAAFGEAPQRALLEELARLGPPIELGGGLRDEASVGWALDAGCQRVILGSMVAKEPERFAAIARSHPGQVVPAVEVAGDAVRIAGWTESAAISLESLCDGLRGLPCPAVLVTDVARDGMLGGPNLELSRRVSELSGLPALLSGGVRSVEDLAAAAAEPAIAGAIVGKALYEGAIDLDAALSACSGTSSTSDQGELE